MNHLSPEMPLGNILIVDDKPDNLRLLSTMLNEQGYETRGVISGPMALRAAQSSPPDLILLDIMMPQMNGYEVCTQLKVDEDTREIPVIFISAKDEVLDKVKAFAVGGVDYITKPFQFEEVLARIENHLTIRKLRNKLQFKNQLLQEEVNSRQAVEKALQEQNLLLQKEVSSRQAVEKVLQRQNILLQNEISNRQAVEKILKEQNTLLQEEIQGRQEAETALQKTNQELARSNADLEQFAYIASHDLQAPLGIIANYAQLLERRYENQLDDKGIRFLHKIMEGTEKMQKLIDDLLEYSRVGRRQKPIETIDFSEIFLEAVDNLQMLIRENETTVTCSELPTVCGKKLRLVQLLQNLINNAIKYRQPEVSPVVEITAEQQENEWLFAVRDNGIGIDPKNSERIFQIFQRLHTSREYSGTGIGLALCKKIVESHGGLIWVESQPDEGSTFYFTLPNLKEK